MEKKVILTTKGNISESDKQHLRKCGIIIAEVKDINAIKLVSGEDYFDIDDISISAIQSLNESTSDSLRARFSDRLIKKILSKYTEKSLTPKPTP